MKIEKTLARLSHKREHSDLNHAARDIGHELSRKRVGLLINLRWRLSQEMGRETDFARGYKTAILDILAAYIDSIAEDQDPLACPGCGCMPGDGRTEGCIDEDGCGFQAEDVVQEISDTLKRMSDNLSNALTIMKDRRDG